MLVLVRANRIELEEDVSDKTQGKSRVLGSVVYAQRSWWLLYYGAWTVR